MAEDEHRIIQFVPREGDVTTSTRIETGRRVLRLIGVLAKKKGMSVKSTRSLAVEVGAQVLLEDYFGKNIVAVDRKDGSMTVIYEAPIEKPSA